MGVVFKSVWVLCLRVCGGGGLQMKSDLNGDIMRKRERGRDYEGQ